MTGMQYANEKNEIHEEEVFSHRQVLIGMLGKWSREAQRPLLVVVGHVSSVVEPSTNL
jgi:hypothetical protein